MSGRREIELKVGRRSNDGHVRLSTYMPGLLTLGVTFGGERASSVMLTREQVRQLRQSLAELEPLIEPEGARAGQWDGGERRKPAA